MWGKHSDEELIVLNDVVSMPSSPEPSTLVHETQQAHHELSPSSEQKGTSTSLVKGPSSRVRLNHPITNILGSLNDNMRLRSKALSVLGTYFYVIGISFDKMHFTCIWVNLSRFKMINISG